MQRERKTNDLDNKSSTWFSIGDVPNPKVESTIFSKFKVLDEGRRLTMKGIE
jgi:hypothetical protein